MTVAFKSKPLPDHGFLRGMILATAIAALVWLLLISVTVLAAYELATR